VVDSRRGKTYVPTYHLLHTVYQFGLDSKTANPEPALPSPQPLKTFEMRRQLFLGKLLGEARSVTQHDSGRCVQHDMSLDQLTIDN